MKPFMANIWDLGPLNLTSSELLFMPQARFPDTNLWSQSMDVDVDIAQKHSNPKKFKRQPTSDQQNNHQTLSCVF